MLPGVSAAPAKVYWTEVEHSVRVSAPLFWFWPVTRRPSTTTWVANMSRKADFASKSALAARSSVSGCLGVALTQLIDLCVGYAGDAAPLDQR